MPRTFAYYAVLAADVSSRISTRCSKHLLWTSEIVFIQACFQSGELSDFSRAFQLATRTFVYRVACELQDDCRVLVQDLQLQL